MTSKDERALAQINTALEKAGASAAEQPAEQNFLSLVLDPVRFELVQRLAALYASSQFGPDAYRGNIANCFAAIEMSMYLRVPVQAFMSNTYPVHNKIGMESKFAIGLANVRGPFDGPIRYKFEGEGDAEKCTAWARLKSTGDLCEATVSWEMVKAEGWDKPKKVKKTGATIISKWMTMREHMFCFRSGIFLVRRYCPEVIIGLQMADELRDIGPKVIDVSDSPGQTSPEDLVGFDPAKSPSPKPKPPEQPVEPPPAPVAEPPVEPVVEPGMAEEPDCGPPLADAAGWMDLCLAARKTLGEKSGGKAQEAVKAVGAVAVAEEYGFRLVVIGHGEGMLRGLAEDKGKFGLAEID